MEGTTFVLPGPLRLVTQKEWSVLYPGRMSDRTQIVLKPELMRKKSKRH